MFFSSKHCVGMGEPGPNTPCVNSTSLKLAAL